LIEFHIRHLPSGELVNCTHYIPTKIVVLIIFKPSTKDKTPTIADEGLLFRWAHQDLSLGPKDYESRSRE